MKGRIQIVAFTRKGAKLAAELANSLDARAYAPEKYIHGESLYPLDESISEWTARHFHSARALIFVGAAGIAVRSVGPLATSKGLDPAVLCVDEAGRFVIPLLSGHIGGANRFARHIAEITGGTPVITTATDVNQVFSPDAWAAANGCRIPNVEQIKAVSAALLEGDKIGLSSDFPAEGRLPDQVCDDPNVRCGIHIGLEERAPFPHTLWMIPCCIRLGIGCRRGVADDVLERAVLQVLRQYEIPVEAVAAVASIDLKAEERALLTFCRKRRLPFTTYTAQRLEQVEGAVGSSDFVRSVTGVDNVCERAALAEGGVLIINKTAVDGVTVAAVKLEWRAIFCM